MAKEGCSPYADSLTITDGQKKPSQGTSPYCTSWENGMVYREE
ncbi:hypothetical protein [Dickeya oryzae]|nr:hypothetical protein [Dickeya oryzae]